MLGILGLFTFGLGDQGFAQHPGAIVLPIYAAVSLVKNSLLKRSIAKAQGATSAPPLQVFGNGRRSEAELTEQAPRAATGPIATTDLEGSQRNMQGTDSGERELGDAVRTVKKSVIRIAGLLFACWFLPGDPAQITLFGWLEVAILLAVVINAVMLYRPVTRLATSYLTAWTKMDRVPGREQYESNVEASARAVTLSVLAFLVYVCLSPWAADNWLGTLLKVGALGAAIWVTVMLWGNAGPVLRLVVGTSPDQGSIPSSGGGVDVECPACKAINGADANFCASCGAKTVRAVPELGKGDTRDYFLSFAKECATAIAPMVTKAKAWAMRLKCATGMHVWASGKCAKCGTPRPEPRPQPPAQPASATTAYSPPQPQPRATATSGWKNASASGFVSQAMKGAAHCRIPISQVPSTVLALSEQLMTRGVSSGDMTQFLHDTLFGLCPDCKQSCSGGLILSAAVMSGSGVIFMSHTSGGGPKQRISSGQCGNASCSNRGQWELFFCADLNSDMLRYIDANYGLTYRPENVYRRPQYLRS